jgi:hypothetical protein
MPSMRRPTVTFDILDGIRSALLWVESGGFEGFEDQPRQIQCFKKAIDWVERMEVYKTKQQREVTT